MQIQPGTQALVIGLGAAGLSTVRYLLGRGVRVRVSDQRHFDQIDPTAHDVLRQAKVELETGGHSLNFLSGTDLVIPGPGVPLDLPLLQAAREQGIPIAGELALAAEQFSAPVIAVTGSNGKTTVTSLIGYLLHAAGRRPFVGGNIGTPLLDYFAAPHDYDVVVLELSSFQLDLAGLFRPDIGLLLNISPDHLDRHGSMSAYINAKMQLFAKQRKGDIAILGNDDPVAIAAPVNDGVRRFVFGRTQVREATVMHGRVLLHIEQDGVSRSELYNLDQTHLRSSVNRLNAAAALLATALHGCCQQELVRGLADFRPPPHRMAEVARVDGVRFINDSKATNIGALEAALGGCEAPVVLIAGGRDKGSDFTLLRAVVASRVKHLIVLGEAAVSMEAALESIVTTERATTMEDAVQRAMMVAARGDIVLLAPGCASFDMFSGYAERGRVFANHVLQLTQGA